MTPFRRLKVRERLGIAIAVGAFFGALLAVFVWAVVENGHRINEIQQSRVSGTLLSCYQQNSRHERLYLAIEIEAAHQREFEPAKYKETVKQGRELERLLDAIQPQENCAERAQRLAEATLHGGSPPEPARIRRPGPLRLTALTEGHR